MKPQSLQPFVPPPHHHLHVFFVINVNKPLSKQSRCLWFEKPLRLCDVTIIYVLLLQSFHTDRPPKNDSYAWVVLFAGFMLCVVAAGQTVILGVFTVEFVHHFKVTTSAITWIGALNLCLGELAGKDVCGSIGDRRDEMMGAQQSKYIEELYTCMYINILRPGQNCRHFVDDILKKIFLDEIILIISPVPKDRGMLWFYVKAARRPPPATRRPPPAMVLTR